LKAAKPKTINIHTVLRGADLQIGGDIKGKSTGKFWYSLPSVLNQCPINFHAKRLVKFIS